MKQKLLTLIMLLVVAVTGAWGAVTYSGTAPATTTHLVASESKTFLDVANTATNAQIKNGSATFALGLHYIINTFKPAWATGSGANSTTSSTAATDNGFLEYLSNSSYDAYTQAYGNVQIKSSQETVLYVTGITGFAVWGKDNGTGSNKQLIIKIAEIASNGTIGTEYSTTSTASTSDHMTEYSGSSLSGSAYYRITLTTGSTSACNTYQVRFTPYVDPRPAAPISWSAASSTAILGESNTFPTLSNEEDLTVAYSSSSTDVATINASTGAITLVAKGSTTISAKYTTSGASDTYKTTTVSFTLNVTNLKAYSNNTFNFSDSDWNGVFSSSASSSTITSHFMEFLSGLKYQDLATSTEKDGLTFTREINTGGSSDASKRLIHLLVAPNSKVTIYARPNGANRAVTISNGSYNSSDKTTLSMSSTSEVYPVSHPNTTGGDVYIYGGTSINFLAVKVEPLKCGTPTFSPASGSIEEGGSVTITSTDATSIKYAWTAGGTDTPESWTTVAATENTISVDVPLQSENTPRLHAYGIATGYTDGDAADVTFTITGVDTTAPALTAQSVADNATNIAVAGDITLTFDENVTVTDASKVSLTGGAATISNVTAEDNVVTITYTGLAYNTAYTLAVASGAITDLAATPNAYAGTSFSFTTIKEPMPAPSISGLGYFIGSQTVSISSEVAGATITYSLDGENYSAYSAPFEISASKTVYAKATHTNYSGEGSARMAMYQISVPVAQEDVTASTTWDFTDENDLKIGDNVENNPIPSTQLLSAVSAYTEKEKAAQISFIMPQRYDAGGYVQAHGFLINTTTPGILSIKFLGGKNGNTRNLMVNGVAKSSSNSTSSEKTASNIEIPAGTTIVYGFDVTSDPNAVNNLRYKTITFTVPTSISATIPTSGWGSYCSSYALDFSDANTECEAYAVSAYDVENLTVTYAKQTGVVPAGTGILLKGDAGATSIVVSDEAGSAPAVNKLVGFTAATDYTKDGATRYLGLSGGNWKEMNAGTIPANKAVLEITASELTTLQEKLASGDAKFTIIFDEGQTDGIASIENGKLNIETSVYNLAGQKVDGAYKGIVIVNGKKVKR